jgi:glycine dehydrogenase subunit 1
VAQASLQRTADLVEALTRIEGVSAAFSAPRFHEAVLLLDRPAAPLLAALARRGILGGLDLAERYPELGNALLVCATETKLGADIDAYAAALAEIMNPARAAA